MPFLSRLKSLVSGNRVNVSTRFALLREAISGTMSNFYMARDLRTNKIVGLKILDAEKTAAFESRFKGLRKPSEGEIAVLLKHPRLVDTYEHGTTTDGAPYLVMEFLEGADLNSLLVGRDARLEGNRLRYIREAAEAVAALHASGFIHRDVCPRNFLLTKDGGTLKLIDFGLTLPAEPTFMKPGVRTGNPNYMAPEIVRRKPTDQRLDVFAFGVTAYEICTGQLPWRRGTSGLAAMTHDQPFTAITQHRPQINGT
ncbi:MAG: serine/threonine-protein kinase, partial [Thermoguttaceae bacterium]